MQELWTEVGLIMFLVLVNAFFAGSEMALVTVRRTLVRGLAEKGSKAAVAIDRLQKDPSKLLATIQVGVTLSGFLASAAAAVSISGVLADALADIPVLRNYAQSLSVIIVTLGVSYVTLVLGELVPKRMALQRAEKFFMVVARPIEFMAKLSGPFIAFLTKSTNLIVKLLGGEIRQREATLTEEEIRLMVAEQGELDEAEKELIEQVFEFGDTVVREVMVPRMEMITMDTDLTIQEALDKLTLSGFTRCPIRDKNVDNIVGIITIKDLINAERNGTGNIR